MHGILITIRPQRVFYLYLGHGDVIFKLKFYLAGRHCVYLILFSNCLQNLIIALINLHMVVCFELRHDLSFDEFMSRKKSYKREIYSATKIYRPLGNANAMASSGEK